MVVTHRLLAWLPSANAKRFLAWSWLAALALVLTCHFATLVRSPVVWQDEVQITDFYRVTLDPQTTWAMQMTEAGKPRIVFLPWVTLLQRAVLGVWGIEPFAVRSLGLVSAGAFAFAFWLVLRGWGWMTWPAAWLALLVACDPALIQSYRGARIDLLAMASLLIAFRAWEQSSRSENWAAWSVAAGFLAALAPLIWPTAIILGAGLFFVAFVGCRPSSGSRWTLQLVLAGVGACAAVATSIALFFLDYSWADVQRAFAEMQAMANQRPPVEWRELLSLYRTPSGGIWFMTLALPFLRRERRGWLWLAGFSVSMLVCFGMPPVYFYRVIYVVPLAYLAAFHWLRNSPRALAAGIVLLLVVNLGYGVAGRTFLTLAQWHERDPQRLGRLLDEHIPSNAIVMGAFGYYYHGLSHGWQMYEHHLPRWRRDLAARRDVFLVTAGPLNKRPLDLNWKPIAKLDYWVRTADGSSRPLELYRHEPSRPE